MEEALAMAAAQTYIAELDRAFVSRSTVAFRTRFEPGCVICEQDADMIDGWLAAGRTVQGGALTYSEVRVVRWDDANHLLLSGQMTTAPSTIKDASGKVVERYAGGVGLVYIPMARVGGTWLVEGISS
jgi:hypothetical protein